MSESTAERFVVQARLLGEERATKKRRTKVHSVQKLACFPACLFIVCFFPHMQYAIEVVLSDESQYTTYRSIKEIANFHVSY